MRSLFKFFMGLQVFLYRLTGGKLGGNMGKFKVLILTTKGRKSGKILSNPVGYFERDGKYIIVASNGGADKNPSWYYNIKGNPNDVTIQVNEKVMKVTPEIVLGERRKPVYEWIASIAPNFGGYEKKTTREIPLVFLKP
ncbi:MAG: nitroreductase/quinone reductase family protein [Anaerolineales bacterium]